MAELVLDTLRELQEADQELRRLEGQKAAQDRILRARAAQIEKRGGEVDALRKKHLQARKQANQKELEVREKRAQIERLKVQQLQIRDNRQYAALQNEIKFAELSISKLEDEILSDYEDIEAVEAQIREVEAEAAKQHKELDALRAEVERQKDQLDGQIQACRAHRKDIEDRLPSDVASRFNQIADRWDGAALVPVVRDEEEGTYSCTGCNMSVTQNVYVLLRGRSSKLLTCPNCSRILYVEDR